MEIMVKIYKTILFMFFCGVYFNSTSFFKSIFQSKEEIFKKGSHFLLSLGYGLFGDSNSY